MLSTKQVQAGRAIAQRRDALADAAIALRRNAASDLNSGNGEVTVHWSRQEICEHLDHLAQTIEFGSPALFAAYVGWAKVVLAGRGGRTEELVVQLESLRAVVLDALPAEEMRELVRGTIDSALQQFAELPRTLPTFLGDQEPLDALARDYLDSLLRGERERASRLIMAAVSQGWSVKDLYLQVFQRTQHEIGRLWQLNQLTVAQEHYCTAATQVIMAQLYSHVFASPRNGRRLLATCVNGESHEIGVRMVSDLFEMEGWDTTYLGANVPAESIVQMMEQKQFDLLCISASTTTNLGAVSDLIAAVRASAAGSAVKILVGGAPFSTDPTLWRTIGADSCATSAEQAIAVATSLLSGGGTR